MKYNLKKIDKQCVHVFGKPIRGHIIDEDPRCTNMIITERTSYKYPLYLYKDSMFQGCYNSAHRTLNQFLKEIRRYKWSCIYKPGATIYFDVDSYSLNSSEFQQLYNLCKRNHGRLALYKSTLSMDDFLYHFTRQYKQEGFNIYHNLPRVHQKDIEELHTILESIAYLGRSAGEHLVRVCMKETT